MASSHVASNAVREGDGADVLNERDSSQALFESCMSLECWLVSVVFAWLSLGIAIDDAVFAAEAFLGPKRIDVTRVAFVATGWGAVRATFVTCVGIGMSKFSKHEVSKSFGPIGDTIALVCDVLCPTPEDVQVNVLDSPVTDMCPWFEGRSPVLGGNLTQAKGVSALSQPLRRNVSWYEEWFTFVGGLGPWPQLALGHRICNDVNVVEVESYLPWCWCRSRCDDQNFVAQDIRSVIGSPRRRMSVPSRRRRAPRARPLSGTVALCAAVATLR